MKKETLFAIILGIGAGVGVAFFVITQTHQNQIKNTNTITPINTTPSVQIKNTESQNLEVSEPQIGILTNKKTVTIKGKATKDSLLVVQSPIKQVAQKLDADSFTVADFPLALGENVILVTVYPKGSPTTSHEKELRIYYMEE